jgi:hypothetical protein
MAQMIVDAPLECLTAALGTSKTPRGIAVVLSSWPSDGNARMASRRRGLADATANVGHRQEPDS